MGAQTSHTDLWPAEQQVQLAVCDEEVTGTPGCDTTQWWKICLQYSRMDCHSRVLRQNTRAIIVHNWQLFSAVSGLMALNCEGCINPSGPQTGDWRGRTGEEHCLVSFIKSFHTFHNTTKTAVGDFTVIKTGSWSDTLLLRFAMMQKKGPSCPFFLWYNNKNENASKTNPLPIGTLSLSLYLHCVQCWAD